MPQNMDLTNCLDDGVVDHVAYGPRRKQPNDWEGQSFVYDPFRYHYPMQVSEILKRFHGAENLEDIENGRESHLSVPSSSTTRSSFVISSPRPSAGLSRAGTGKSNRPRFPIEVDVKTQEQWEELLAKEGLIVVDAYAGWCGPCKAIESTFRRMRNETGDDLLHFAMAETDNIESLEAYRDKSRPTFLFYGGGELVHVIRGCDAPSLVRSITHHLKEEHRILSGDAERKVFIDVEVQQQQQKVEEEKQDQEKQANEEEDEEMAGDVFSQFAPFEEVVEVPKEVSVVIIKPDALRSGHAEEIIQNIEDCGVEILHKEEKVLTKEEAAEFYKQHEGSEHFEQLIEFMSSGPVLTLVLSKKGDDPGYGLIPEVRDLIGPKDVNLAKEEAPQSIRAQYGTDAIMNAVHSCDSSESAARELAFFFPDFNVPKVHEKRKKKRIQRTLALIRPNAYAQRKESILQKVTEAGFNIAMSKEMYLTREQAEEFYEEHKDKDYFESLVNNMTSGPTMALCLAREEAVETWRNMLGPKEVQQAKEEAPESLRAVFAEEGSEINPLHGAESIEAAEKELRTFFPPQATVGVIKPEAYGEPEQREEIVEKIKQAGFKISAQKEIQLTKELAQQFYKEHEGKEFFDGLTDYMSSGPMLFMILSREDAVSGFRALVGPTEPDVAKEQAPNSLRALYATDPMKNAIHSSSNVEKAASVIHTYFPEIELNEDGTIKEPPKEEEPVEEAKVTDDQEGESAEVQDRNQEGESEAKQDDVQQNEGSTENTATDEDGSNLEASKESEETGNQEPVANEDENNNAASKDGKEAEVEGNENEAEKEGVSAENNKENEKQEATGEEGKQEGSAEEQNVENSADSKEDKHDDDSNKSNEEGKEVENPESKELTENESKPDTEAENAPAENPSNEDQNEVPKTDAGGTTENTSQSEEVQQSVEKTGGDMPESRSIVLSGPSGCGKSTIIKKLMKEFPDKFGFSVSHTTRLPRPGEVHGKDYHFTTKDAMQKEIDAGEFIEHAIFNKNFYGTSKKSVQDVFTEGRTCILDIDRQGVISVKKTDLDCLLIFVKPPNLEELEKRLRGRGTETEESIQRRLNTSKEEFAYAEIPGSYDYILINDDLDRAYDEFKSIIDKEVTKLL